MSATLAIIFPNPQFERGQRGKQSKEARTGPSQESLTDSKSRYTRYPFGVPPDSNDLKPLNVLPSKS